MKSNSCITKKLILYSELLKMEFDSWIQKELSLHSGVCDCLTVCSNLTKVFSTNSFIRKTIEKDSIIFIEGVN